MNDLLYTDRILTHYYAPTHYGLAEDFDVEGRGVNSLCGDSVVLRVKFAGDSLAMISFESEGCVLSRAAASILAGYAEGKRREAVQGLSAAEMLALFGVPVTPVRTSCVTLALEALRGAL